MVEIAFTNSKTHLISSSKKILKSSSARNQMRIIPLSTQIPISMITSSKKIKMQLLMKRFYSKALVLIIICNHLMLTPNLQGTKNIKAFQRTLMTIVQQRKVWCFKIITFLTSNNKIAVQKRKCSKLLK